MFRRIPIPSLAGRRLRRRVGIGRDELGRVVALSLAFFLLIATYWIQKPIRTSKFLSAIGVEFLPAVKLATAVLIVPVVLLYTSLAKRYQRESMVALCAIAFSACSLGFWYLFRGQTPAWTHYAYFFFFDLYVTVMVAVFWSFAGDLTSPRRAGSVYGLIGTAGILGGMAGGALTGWTVERLDAESLLLACAAMLALIASAALVSTRPARAREAARALLDLAARRPDGREGDGAQPPLSCTASVGTSAGGIPWRASTTSSWGCPGRSGRPGRWVASTSYRSRSSARWASRRTDTFASSFMTRSR